MSVIKSYGIIAMRRPPNMNHHSSSLLHNIRPGRFLLSPSDVECDGCKALLASIQLETENDVVDKEVTFVMYQRKHTNAYWDIISGKATLTNLRVLVSELTCRERKMILATNFNQLWDTLGMRDGKARARESWNRIEQSLTLLIEQFDAQDHHIPYAEIGFPKGRKISSETCEDAAMREFCEETGYQPRDVHVNWHEPPLEEEFRGSDGRIYKCIYHIGWVNTYVIPRFDFTDPRQGGEVLNIGFFTAKQAVKLFRPYESSKRELLQQALIRRAI